MYTSENEDRTEKSRRYEVQGQGQVERYRQTSTPCRASRPSDDRDRCVLHAGVCFNDTDINGVCLLSIVDSYDV